MPKVSPAARICLVTARSSAEGVGSPDGWLCTRMTEAALCAIAGRKTSRGCTSEAFRIPRVTVTSRMTPCCASRSRTWNSSWRRSRSRGSMNSNTSRAPRMGRGAVQASRLTLRPTSMDATSRLARAGPTPGMRRRACTGVRANSESELPASRSTAAPISIALRLRSPEPTNSATSSTSLSDSAPSASRRSRGRSWDAGGFSCRGTSCTSCHSHKDRGHCDPALCRR